MSSCDVKTAMGSDSCPTMLENQVMFSVQLIDKTVEDLIITSSNGQDDIRYFNHAVNKYGDRVMHHMHNVTVYGFMNQFAHKVVRSKTLGMTAFLKVVMPSRAVCNFAFRIAFDGSMHMFIIDDHENEVLLGSNDGRNWVGLLESVMTFVS